MKATPVEKAMLQMIWARRIRPYARAFQYYRLRIKRLCRPYKLIFKAFIVLARITDLFSLWILVTAGCMIGLWWSTTPDGQAMLAQVGPAGVNTMAKFFAVFYFMLLLLAGIFRWISDIGSDKK